MESTRNDTQLNPQHNSIEHIKSLLNSQYIHLLKHQQYLDHIIGGKTSPDDVTEYLNELLGANNYDRKSANRKTLLTEIRVILVEKINQCLVLIKAMRIEDREQALCVSHVLAHQFFLASTQLQHSLANKYVTRDKKIQAAFHDVDFYSHIHYLLKNQLPDSFQGLSKVIIINEKQSVESTNAIYSSSISYSYSSHISYNWGAFRFEKQQLLKKHLARLLGQKKLTKLVAAEGLGREAKIQPPVDMPDTIGLPDGFLEDFQNDHHVLNAVIKRNNTWVIKSLNDLLEQLKFNVENYFKLNSILETFKKISESITNTMMLKDKLDEKYEKISTLIFKEIDVLKIYSTNLTDLLQPYLSADHTDKIKLELETYHNNLTALSLSISDIASTWHKTRPADLKSELDIEALSKSTYKTLDEISTKLNATNDSLLQFIDHLHDMERSKQSKLEAIEQEKSIALQKEHQAFLEKQAQRLQKHKEAISKSELSKQALRKNTFFAPKSEQVEKDFIEYKNVKMSELLDNLNVNQLEFILSIMALKKGITFDEVCNFIKTHLNGKILEIGNGSSHKRIILEKYIIKVPLHANPEQHKLATGGFHNPHGEAHSSGVLSKFSLGLVNDAFTAAGITLEVIKNLLDKKLEQKLSKTNG